MTSPALTDLVTQVSAFGTWTHTQKIVFFGWFLHTHRERDRFDQSSVRACYDELHLVPPDLSVYFKRMSTRKPAELLKDSNGYRLGGPTRQRLDSQYGEATRTIAVARLIAELPTKVPGIEERAFLSEVIACYRVKAFRAAIVMSWNLAFDHLLRWILHEPSRLASFNAAISRRFAKNLTVIARFDDFEHLKEYEVVEICVTANLVSGSVAKILREKLSRRNMAAHPSGVDVTQFQAEDVITDLVNNVVLRLT